MDFSKKKFDFKIFHENGESLKNMDDSSVLISSFLLESRILESSNRFSREKMSRMLKTLVLVITVIITEITCEEIHFKSCPIGDVNKKLQFSKATCDDCLQKSKGRVGNKCRFTGPPLLEPPTGVSPRAHTKKFVDLVNKMMKESASGVRFTYAELKRRLQDENIPVQKSNWALDDRTLQHWTKEPYVLPKISKSLHKSAWTLLRSVRYFFNPPLW